MAEIVLPHNWSRRDDQAPLWDYLRQHLEKGKQGLRAVEVAHRRWGKDDIAIHFTACAAHTRVGNYWHLLPKYEQARKAIWDAINPHTGKRRIDEAFPIELRRKTNQQEMKIELNSGSIWQLVGSDNYNNYMGSPPVGIVLSEWALANPMAWAYLSPILEENGGWALFVSTARGRNHLKTFYDFAKKEPGWFAELTPASKTPVFTPDKLETIRRQYHAQFGEDTGEALYQQEYHCSFEGAVYGSYYSAQLSTARNEGRITGVPWVPGHEVYTAWDLGIDDSTSIWFFQVIGPQFRFIDYYENTGKGFIHYAQELKSKPYVYGDHYLPHDADARQQGEQASSPKQTLEGVGIKPIIVVKRAKDTEAVMRGIDNSRNVLPQCWFDEKKCKHGLEALEEYHADFDEEKRKLDNRPVHSWASHASDAFRTFAVGYVPKRGREKSVYEMMGV